MLVIQILGVPKMSILENHNYEITKNNVLFRKYKCGTVDAA